MSAINNIWAVLSLTLAIGIWLVFQYVLKPELLADEPPALDSRIPYIGHIIGLLRHGIVYYKMTSDKCRLPIYTLNMLNGKVYIVTSPELVAAVHRNSKSLSFNPFIAQLGMRITGHDEATSRIVQHNLNGEEGPGYVTEVHDGTVTALAPGVSLEKMIQPMLNEVDSFLQNFQTGAKVRLFSWVREMATLCSASAIYGPSNPFSENASLSTLFWDFDHDLDRLILNIFPRLLAPKGSFARSEIGSGFQRYFELYTPGKTQSSAMILNRHAMNTKWDVSSWNQGRLEVGILLGVLANTIPATFYMLTYIYSDPALLQQIRAELETHSVSEFKGTHVRNLHVMSVRKNCHLLHSCLQEVLRLHAQGASSRFVREDTWLNGQYLLKKNMVVQMPMAVTHLDPSIWGSDAHLFRPRRFLKQDSERAGVKQAATAFRPWGGGSSMCPGRHWATIEIMTLTAYLVLKYDMVPAEGTWKVPASKQESLATNVFPPKEDVEVQIMERSGCEGTVWEFDV